MKTRILVLDPIAPEGLAMLRGDSDFEYEERHGLKGQDLKDSLAQFDGAIAAV
jgi:D-3-phosphoglycerate dehydrogenase